MSKFNFVSVLLILFLTSCMKVGLYNDPRMSQCTAQCISKGQYCQQHCGNNCPNCIVKANQNSLFRFINYKHECDIQGKKVMRELNSYRDPLQCRKVTCNCVADLEVCKQSCSGVIHKRLQTAPNCI